MLSGITIKYTNRISSYSSLQNYKMHIMVTYRNVKYMSRLRYYSSLQNYKMHDYGKLPKYTMHELGFYSPLQNYKMQKYGNMLFFTAEIQKARMR
jgi:hypothetical protein